MANHSLPTQTSGYLDFVTQMDFRFDDLARGLDPAKSPVGDPNISNLPVDSIGWSSENKKWRKWDGSSWVSLVSDDTYSINISGTAGSVTNGVYTVGNQTIAGVKTFSSTISGSINGNAATVTNGVYTTGDQTIAGVKTFSSTIIGSINGNAGTVTNGVYTTGDQTIAGIKTFNSTISGSIDGNAGTVTNGVYTTGNQTITGTKTFSSPIVGSLSGNATTATTADKAKKLTTTNWTVEEVSGILYIKYGTTTVFSIDAAGNILTAGEVSTNRSF